MTTSLDAALYYAARGWRVIPIPPSKKHPAGFDAWQQQATCDPALIAEWWGRWPGHGVGIATGAESGIFVLDVDVSDGKRGDDTLAELEHEHGRLPDTVEVITGSGGRHLYFAVPAGVDIRNDQAAMLGPGLDIRGEGGQVLAPPTVHPNGTPYQWEVGGDPYTGCPVADPPAWLIELLTSKPDPTTVRRERATRDGARLPGDIFATMVTWPDLLEADGAHFIRAGRDRAGNGYELWARPGVSHASASLYYGGSDVLKVFTPNWEVHDPETGEIVTLEQDATYTKFGYYAATRHGGDMRKAAAALGGEQRAEMEREWMDSLKPAAPAELIVESQTATAITDGAEVDEDAARWGAMVIDWPALWGRDHSAEEWVAWPLVPAKRQVALFAPAKTGKSLLTLAVVAACATGKPILGRPAQPPKHVLYLDYEMTESDLVERLDTLGYSADDDLSHFHYALLPSLPKLDTPEGARALCDMAAHFHAEVVVIDTMGRAVAGEENEADTYRDFAKYTGYALKQAGRAVVRTDHAGKDKEKGQRGSSAKNDDVDVVLRLDATQDGFVIRRTHSRVNWVPETVNVKRLEHIDREEFVVDEKKSAPYPEGTRELAERLDELGVDPLLSVGKVQAALRAVGEGRARKLVVAAVRWRKEQFDASYLGSLEPRTAPGTDISDTVGNRSGTAEGQNRETAGQRAQNRLSEPLRTAGTAASGTPGTARPPKGAAGSQPPPASARKPTGYLFAPIDATTEDA